MRQRSLILLPLLIALFIILTKYNGAVKSFFLDFINPVKIAYLNLTEISDSYMKQQASILSLKEENSNLKKLLNEQSNYIEQLSKIYKIVPSLIKKPYKNIYIVNTISYVKLNKLNEIILTTPKKLLDSKKKLFGVMQNDYVAGVAHIADGKLYAYLLSHPKCNFSVSIGKNYANGIAQGDGKQGMVIKFIPRWSQIEIGDIVKTSGLDNIFFSNIPVGVVTDVKTLDTYKLAKVEINANLDRPSTLFLISDSTPYINANYIPESTFPKIIYPYIPTNNSNNIETPVVTQTKDKTLEPIKIDEDQYLDIFNKNDIINNKIDLKSNHK